MNPDSKVRTMVRQIPPLYWLAGLVNYLRFRRGLAREERIYRAVGQVTSPPPLLRYRVHRAFDEASYIRNGQTIAQALADALNGVGVELWNLDVLDFACGPGRVIREFQTHARGCRMYGSDIDAEAIAFMLQHGEAKVLLTDREFSGVIGVKNEVAPCSLLKPTRVRSANRELMS